MNVLLHIFRGLIAVLVALGMQLPCPCPSIAAANADAGAEDEAHSCCPGMDDGAEAKQKSPEQSEEGHACSHCSDDNFTKAPAVELPSDSSLATDLGPLSVPVALLGPNGFLLAHPAGESAEHLLDRPPPEPLAALPTGRNIRTQTCSFLC